MHSKFQFVYTSGSAPVRHNWRVGGDVASCRGMIQAATAQELWSP